MPSIRGGGGGIALPITEADVTALVADLADRVSKTVWDTNSVLAATADDTPAAVTMGPSTILARLAAGNIKAASIAEIAALLAPSMPGYELGYVEATGASQTSAQTARASAVTLLTAPSITFDGASDVIVEMGWSAVQEDTSAAAAVVCLWEDSTDRGIMLQLSISGTDPSPISTETFKFRYRPTAGAKVLTARGWVTSASTMTVFGGTGASAGRMPGFLRITKAN